MGDVDIRNCTEITYTTCAGYFFEVKLINQLVNQRLAVKRVLERKEQLEKAALDQLYQQSLREAARLYGQNLL